MNPHTLELRCPHCDQKLQPFELPDNTGWQGDFQLACFNDDCPYYRRGWDWMMERYAVRASYRYRIDPASGKASPLAVWSETALRDRLLDADVTATKEASEAPPQDESAKDAKKESPQ